MRAPLRRFGNSRGIILPKPVLAQLGIGKDDELEMRVEQDRIVLTRRPATPRAGWAKAAARIAAAGDDALVWTEFAHEGDSTLEW